MSPFSLSPPLEISHRLTDTRKHCRQAKKVRELERESILDKMEKAELADRLAKAEEENEILAQEAAAERESTQTQYSKRLTQLASGEKTQKGQIGAMQDALRERDSRLAEMEDNETVLREQHEREVDELRAKVQDLEDVIAEVKDSRNVQRDALEAENRRLWVCWESGRRRGMGRRRRGSRRRRLSGNGCLYSFACLIDFSSHRKQVATTTSARGLADRLSSGQQRGVQARRAPAGKAAHGQRN